MIYEKTNNPSSLLCGTLEYGGMRYKHRTASYRESADNGIETVITETPLETTPPVTAVEPTEKEKEPVTTENEDQVTEPTGVATEPTTTRPTEETTTTTSAVGEKSTSPIEETVPSTTP